MSKFTQTQKEHLVFEHFHVSYNDKNDKMYTATNNDKEFRAKTFRKVVLKAFDSLPI
jgi:hypothetical protein